ncbi:DUF1672 family protein [Sporolactobacillus shoreae]|uniref:DUF1672 family protein n=1 Tax=Sporolactobacillus shoreae TaxID=1465501 RepID=A0A4Z0GSP9_9BACL|nr:DUF1672 family protein [Sporolactobacillus shoreae]TGA99936.1 DUF1672 family protein [Sporolactobacillus shoreae]
MKVKKLLIPILSISLFLGGCSLLDNVHQSNSSTKAGNSKQNNNAFMSVQKYTGQGYSLDGGAENDKIAEAHRSEVIQAVQNFFLKKYKTQVKVHNLVGNRDGVTVFVESIGEPHFYTYAVIPIDQASKKVLTDGVFSENGRVEDAISTGIYAMIYDKEFRNLDNYLSKVVSKYPITGIRQEAVENVGGDGYSTPYYYTSIANKAISVNVIDLYLKHPDWNKDEWKKALKDATVDPKFILITLQLFMESPNQKPSKAIFNSIIADIEQMKGLPPGSYSIFLNDNRIDEQTARGATDHVLERADPYEIIKY